MGSYANELFSVQCGTYSFVLNKVGDLANALNLCFYVISSYLLLEHVEFLGLCLVVENCIRELCVEQ